MNEDEFQTLLSEEYARYCEYLEIPPRQDVFEAYHEMAKTRVEELCEGGLSIETAIHVYMNNESTSDIEYNRKMIKDGISRNV